MVKSGNETFFGRGFAHDDEPLPSVKRDGRVRSLSLKRPRGDSRVESEDCGSGRSS